MLAALLSGVVWGLFEATWFFLVPDILLCYWAMRSWKQASVATAAVVLGSMMGAVLLWLGWYWGNEGFASVMERIWNALPGFGPRMSVVAAGHISDGGARGLIYGPSSGIPFRVYCLEAWKQHVSLLGILVWTPIARLQRIVIAPIAVSLLRVVFERWLPRLTRSKNARPWRVALAGLIVLYWIGLYVWYWGLYLPREYGP